VTVFGIPRRELKIFLERSLNKRERELLLNCYRYQGYTFSQVVNKLNGYPQSTVKLVLRRLKGFNLIDFGDNKEKGKPLNFTKLGEKLSEILRGESR